MYRCEDCNELFEVPTVRTFREWLGEFYRPYTCEYCPACGSEFFHETEDDDECPE